MEIYKNKRRTKAILWCHLVMGLHNGALAKKSKGSCFPGREGRGGKRMRWESICSKIYIKMRPSTFATAQERHNFDSDTAFPESSTSPGKATDSSPCKC